MLFFPCVFFFIFGFYLLSDDVIVGVQHQSVVVVQHQSVVVGGGRTNAQRMRNLCKKRIKITT